MSGGGTDGLGRDQANRYERIERIATGGMGEVWRARDTVLGREVAVKVLKQEYADDPTFRARFAGEARHAASLHHPGIAAIFDYGALEGETPYLVMELVDGRPLSELLADGRPIDPEQARLLALQVAEALAVAHHAGVVHRDVKPANLLVTPDGRVKITDFGIARAVDSVAYTQTGQIVGTPHYISPEQARGETATAASDVYALGVVLFECLNGSRPFAADSPIATALAHIRDEVPPLPEHVPAELDHVVRRAMAKDPAERYPDGAAFAAALRDAGGSGAVPPPPATTQVMPAAVPAAMTPAAAPATSTTPAAAEPGTGRVTTTRTANRWPLYAAGALALLVLVVLLVAHPWTSNTAEDTGGTAPGSDTVRVRPAAYIGDPVDQVEAALADKGLKTRRHEIDNSGDHVADTVADLGPTGKVRTGTTITLDVWGQPTSQQGDQQGDQGNKGHGSDQKTKAPKPEQTKAPKPEKTKQPPPPGTSDTPGTSNGKTTGGTTTGSGTTGGTTGGTSGSGTTTSSQAPGGRTDPKPKPSPGAKGD